MDIEENCEEFGERPVEKFLFFLNTMDGNVIYKDKLVEVSSDSILLKNYYFPFIGKRIQFT